MSHPVRLAERDHARARGAGPRPFGILLWILGLLWLGTSACGRRTEEPTEASTAPETVGVAHVRVEGELDLGNQALISRALRTARQHGDTTLVIEIDTPGGAVDIMWAIQKQLLDAESHGLTCVAWVHHHAISAGSFVVLTCPRVYISSAGSIGSAMPVTIGPNGMEELSPGVREKEMSILRSQFASIAEKRGRPAALAVGMVDRDVEVRQVKVDGELRLVGGEEWNSLRERGANYEFVRTIKPAGQLVNLTAREAVEFRVADGTADTLDQVIDKLGLRTTARVGDVMERSNSESFVAWLQRLTPLLLLAGLVLGYVELKMPGFGLPGILSIVCFALLLAGQYLAGLADVPHIVAVALGAGLIVVEVFVLPGTLWLGIVGLILVVGGLVLGSLGPGFDFASPMDQRLVVSVSARILVSAAVALIAAMALTRFLPKTPVGKHLILAPSPDVAAFGGAMPESMGDLQARAQVGGLGMVCSDLRPVGKVTLDATGDHEWEARSTGPLVPRGVRVRVTEVTAGRIVVERAEETT